MLNKVSSNKVLSNIIISKKLTLKVLKNYAILLLANFCLLPKALAEASTPQPENFTQTALGNGLMLAAFALIFYFLILRPQSKRAKEQRSLIAGLQKGDEVLTAGGILGRISKVNEDFLSITIAEGIDILVQKQAISTLLPKGTMKSI